MKRAMMLLVMALGLALLAGCVGKLAAPAETSSGGIKVPYTGLGDFVNEDGTVNQEGLWKEAERRNEEEYLRCKKEALAKERKLLWKNCSAWSGIFWAIKENYWDKEESQ